MRTPSGTLHVVDFKTSQIVSNIQTKDYWDDKRHWEIKNNIDTLEFKVFDNTEHAATLMQQNLVLKEVRDGRIVPYVITETEKDSNDRSVIAYASGEWIQLAKAGIIAPQKVEGKTVNEFIDMALAGTKWKRGRTEYAGFHTMTIDEFISPLKLLKDIASLFELEIQYRAEVVGSQIVSRYVDMVKKRGQETGKEVTLGKDLVGIKRVENSQNICTALLGFSKKEGEGFITITDINDGIPYLVDSDAFQRWNERGQHKFGFYTPETEGDITPKRLMTLMKTELAKRINSSISYDVQAQSIGRVFGLAHELINEGDTIRIKDTGFTPKLYLEARAIAGDESFTDPSQDKYIFGDYREITDPNEEMRKLYNRVLASLGNKANKELLEQLEKLAEEAKGAAEQAQKESKAAKDIAEETKDYMDQNLVDIIEGANPPTTGLKPNKTLWRDISNGKPGILKIWTGTAWEPVVPDTGPLQQSIKDVKKDIETAKTELNQKVQSVESKAQEIAGQIVDVQKQVNGKVDQTWIDNQLKDKADKSGVYTKDEIKDGFIGKQIYETDKQGNVQNFKDINTSIGQTNEALKQKAEKSELTKTNDGLTKLQNKTNEIETTANGTKQKLTELETTVNNTNVGVRNYVLDSDKFISPPDTNQSFRFVNDLKDLQGKQITVSVYVEIKNAKTGVNPSNRVGFEPSIRYSDNSIQHLGAWLRITDGMNFKGIISTTIWIKDIGILKTEQNAVYIQCGGDYVKVGRPKIEIGNKVTDWTPAPEDNVSNTDFTKKTVEIETTIKGINTSVSNVQNEQGKLTERMTKSEQTADGFKTSIESLTKKDTEISNKLNTVESTVEGTKKTISDVQQTTSELKKTTTEITEKAGQISEKLISVEQKYDNMKIGGQNFYKQKSFGAAGGTTAKYDDSNKWWDIAIPAGASGSWKGILYTSKNAVLLVGRTYTISYEIYADEVIPTAIDINNFGVTTVTGTNDNDLVAKRIMRTPKTIAGQWVKVSATFIMPDNITQDFYDNSVIGVGNGWTPTKITNIKIRNMQLEEGNIPTSYRTPSEDQVTTDEFTKKTTDIEKSVDGVKTTVSTVQKDQGTMQSTLNQVKQTTDSNSQTIATLSQTQGKQGAIIQQNTSDITQLNNQIKSKVTDTQMQEYVGGLGSTNLLFNVAFEDRVINASTGVVTSKTPSTTKWSLAGTGSGITIVPESARHHEGYNSVKITATGQTASKWSGIMQRVPAVQNGGDYVFSAWVYVQDKNTLDNGGAIKLQFFNGANAVSTFVQTEFKDLLVNNSWVLVSVKITSPNVAITHLQGDIWVRQNGTIWVSQPQLQQGSTRSTFMENPKDYANYDQLVGEIAKKVATADFDSKVSKMETTINQQSNRIDLKAEKTDVYTKTEANGQFGSKAMVEKHESSITLMSNQINSTVKKGDIISSINQTAEKITIDVSKLAINADTMVQWLTAKGIDTNIIKVNGDKITIDKNGVTIKMLDFLFEDEWGTKTTVMPKRNLIADHDFSSVPKLNIGNPNYQGFGAGYGLPWKVQGNGVVIENNTFIFNYEQMVNAVRVDTYNYPETKVQNGIHPGNTYTLSAHYRTAQINGVRVTAKPRLQVCFVTPLDEVSYKIWHEIYKDFPEPSTFYGEIRRYNFTFTVPNNYNPQEHMIVIKVTAANAQVSAGRAVCVSGITLVSGNYACMYNWDRAAAERADGLQPFNRIAIGGVNNNIGPADHGQTFDISTEKDVFINQPILTQGINLGRNRMGQAGSIRFFDGGQGYGFYFMGMGGQWYKLPNV
ncbi:peptidase S74 [Bacillus thuringiensis serovar subtoxicus]|uniref:Peptidase S74 n=6 Tax=Bacillus cereus group TaxID=86661 RepID=A0A9X6FF99_BACTU|nr:phage tail spike protein [Bacillus thuringiensis]MEB8613657.1 phage tail spike protein [Bacillus cereus]MCR6850548.1 phage tail protein [Bacillus thuringiensis]MDR4282802.1 peptidase S74 [Bacillus thuringiensis]MEB8834900.1 phage tail spike protein [Bacillus cereus]MEB9276551.1 phage tail spike protein [Bacillus cereus]